MLGRGCDIVCVRAVSGGAALGNDVEDFARKRAVEAGAITLAGSAGGGCVEVSEGTVSNDGGGCDGADGMGSVTRYGH
jgi:hypothetical protein